MKKILTAILACVICVTIAAAATGCGCQKSKKNNSNENSENNKPGYTIVPTEPDFVSGSFGFYRLSQKELKVTKYTGTEKNVVIPSEVDGAKVTIIERSLFRKAEFESVTIPSSIYEIQDYAFAECKNLKEIVIPEGVKNIGDDAFWNCKKLTSIALPDTLKKVEWYAFSATGLTSVTIPESKTFVTLNERVFFQCAGLKEVILPLSITKIADDTFAECAPDLTIKAYTGSYGVSYAKSHNIALEELPRS